MNDPEKTGPPGGSPDGTAPKTQHHGLLHTPGLVAVGIYMLLLAFTIIIGVARGHFPPLYLVFPVLFIAAGLGLLKLFRWAWTLTLAAVVMLAGFFLWNYASQHQPVTLMQGLVNLVIFLYLVRTEIRSKLR